MIEQYADIFDALPPIEVNQHNEVSDGWHRVRAAERASKSEIGFILVETKDDDDLADKLWAANALHGVPYTREQRESRSLKLHERGLSVKEIAERVGVSVSTVRRWTAQLRREEKLIRDERIVTLAEKGKSQEHIAEEVG